MIAALLIFFAGMAMGAIHDMRPTFWRALASSAVLTGMMLVGKYLLR